MNILFTGKTDFEYNRVKILIDGLNKLEEVELTVYPIKNRKQFDYAYFKELQSKADFIYVPPFRHRDVAFIKKLTDKPLVFDPLISKFLTKADFGQFWKMPFKYMLDKVPFSRCDILLSDTQCHKEYFSSKFSIPPGKIHVLPIGVGTDEFYKKEKVRKEGEPFRVGFYGSFVPLQGTDKIVEAAYHLKDHEDIVFDIIGNGYRFKQAENLVKKWNLKNVNFLGTLRYAELNNAINQFDLSLGIFGDSEKADFVIPNKIYHYASVGQCILTRNTRGVKELFQDGENIALCETDPKDIAQSILNLKADPQKIERLGQAAYSLITEHYNEVEIAKRFVKILQSYQA